MHPLFARLSNNNNNNNKNAKHHTKNREDNNEKYVSATHDLEAVESKRIL